MRCFLPWLIAWALLTCVAETAFARDLDGHYAGAALSDWYKAQRNISGQVCCDDADGHEVTSWGHTVDGLYWVEYDGERHSVPRTAVVMGMHPQGKAVVWIYPARTLRCFLPGMEG